MAGDEDMNHQEMIENKEWLIKQRLQTIIFYFS